MVLMSAAEAQQLASAAILRQLTEGVIVTDVMGTIKFVNDAAAALHGVAELNVRPNAYSDTYHLYTEDGRPYPSNELPLARAVRGETVKNARWRIRRPDGTNVLAVGNALPLHGANGQRIGAVLTLRDETARDASERSQRAKEASLREIIEKRAEADSRQAAARSTECARIRTGLDELLRYADALAGTASDEMGTVREELSAAGSALRSMIDKLLDRPDASPDADHLKVG